MTEHAPVACDMTNAIDSPTERLAAYDRLLSAALIGRDRSALGMRWTLRSGAGVEDQARDLAARENECCAFMTNTISTGDGVVYWDAVTRDDPAAQAVIDLFYDLPTRLR